MTSFILMAAMGGGGGAGSLIPNVELPGVFDMCRAKPEAPDEKFVNAPPPQEGPLYLRMLFLSGTDLAAGDITGSSDPYVDVRFGGQVFCSPPQMTTLNPVWDYLLETEIKEPGVMRITVYDQDFGRQGDKLGDCEIQIAKTPMKIRKETLPLQHVPSSFLQKAPNSRITVLYHIVDRLEDQPDLLELSKQIGEDGGEAATPQDYMVRVHVLQGSQLDFFLYNSTIEDLIQNRLKLEWILRQGTEEELDSVQTLYLRRSKHEEEEQEMPKTSVRVQVEDFKAQAVAEHRRSEERVSQGDPGEDKPDGAEGHEGERLARASVSSGEEVADATAHTTGRQDVSQEAEEKQATASKGAEKREQGKWKDVRFERVGSQEDTSDNPEGRQSRRKTAAGYSLEHRSQKAKRRGKTKAEGAQKRPRFMTFGAWAFPLDEIREFCVEKKVCAWAGRAVLINATRMKVGEVLLHVDVFTSKESSRELVDLYRFPPPIQQGVELPPPRPLRKKPKPSTSRAKEGAEPTPSTEDSPEDQAEKSKQKAHEVSPGLKQRDGTYYVYLYADFLPKTDTNYNTCQWDNCDPFVTLVSQNVGSKCNSWNTTVKSDQQRECVWDPIAIQMPRNTRKQKLTLDVFDSDSPLVFGNSLLKEQVGFARLLRVPLNKPMWLHMYGGNFEGKRGEYNTMMMKGGLDPPSTYHGSLCVLVDNKRIRRKDWPPFPDKVGLLVRIEVRLARGLYLPDMYRNREVSVLIQVAGCLLELPDSDVEEHQKGSRFFARRSRKRRALTRDLEGIRKCREMDDIPDANFDLLEFPGYVNSRGVLRFYNWSRSRQEMEDEHSVSAYRKGEEASEESGDESKDEKKDRKKNGQHRRPAQPSGILPPKDRLEEDLDYPESLLNVWVKRITDPVYLLPKVQWVYVYIIAVGEEEEPPRLFGRLPLQGSTKVKTFLEGQTGGDDGSWPPPQALLKAKKRDSEGDEDDGLDTVKDGKESEVPGGSDGPGLDTIPPHPAVLLREKGTGALGGGSTTLRELEDQAAEANFRGEMKWIQVHWDQSVTPLPACRFPSTFAGCLLGEARAVITEDPASLPLARARQEQQLGAPTEETTLLGGQDRLHEDEDELIVTYDNEPLEQVPRPTEVSVMCGMDTVTRREGHVGWRVEYESILGAPRSNGQGRGGNGGIAGADRAKAVSPFYRQVYFHSDILQARNLPAMDADASLNPWWTIEVETEVIKLIQERYIDKDLKVLGSTANPSFLARAVAPVYLYTAPAAQRSPGASSSAPGHGPSSPLPALRDDNDKAGGGGGLGRRASHASMESSNGGERGLPAFDDLALPPPPIVVRLFDIDIGSKGEIEKEMMSIVVDWDPANLDKRQREFGDSLFQQEVEHLKLGSDVGKKGASSSQTRRTDPNFANEAVWYSLLDNEQLAFDAVERSFTLGASWQGKPRLLASVGFASSACSAYAESLVRETDDAWRNAVAAFYATPSKQWAMVFSPPRPEWPVVRLTDPKLVEAESFKLLYYEIDLDILGLRILDSGGLDPGTDYVLRISSFWPDDPAKPLEFLISCDDFPGPNVVSQFSENPLKQRLRRKVVCIPDSETFRKSKQVALPIRKTAGNTAVPGVWVGARVSPPLFITPYLPYLQALLPSKQRRELKQAEDHDGSVTPGSAEESSRKGHLGIRSVLPDINFRLISREGGEVASLGVSINEFLKVPQGERALQLQLASPELARLPPPKMDRNLMEQYLVPELPYTTVSNVDVILECFADISGDLLYDDDLLVGRTLTDHDMYFIKNLQTDEIVIHILNADDYFVGDPDRMNVPFEEPLLKVADLSDPGPSPAEYDDAMSLLKGEKDTGGRPFFPTLTARKSTKIQDKTSMEMENAADQNRVRTALRTWIRKPGHKANPEQTGSCLLARLQMLKTVYKTAKRRRTRRSTIAVTQGSLFDRDFVGTYNMVNIFTKEEGVVVWAYEAEDVDGKEKLFGDAGELILVFQSTQDKKFHRICVPSFDIRYPAENGYFILDSITENFLDLSKMALEQKLHRKVAAMKMLKRHSGADDNEEVDQLAVEIEELEDNIEKLKPLTGGYLKNEDRKAGFATPIPVSRGQLVCRLKKRGTMFDRNQTQIWYDNFEVLPANNLSTYLVWGEEKKKITQLKGWIKVTDVTQKQMALEAQRSRRRSSSQLLSLGNNHKSDRPEKTGRDQTAPAALGDRSASDSNHKSDEAEYEKAMEKSNALLAVSKQSNAAIIQQQKKSLGESGQRTPSIASDASDASTRCSWNGSEIDTPVISIAPPMQRWVVETVVVHLYVLTGRNLLNVDLFGKSDPYLKVCLGDQTVISDNVFDNNDNPDFYEHFVFPVLIPGAAKLQIIVMDKGDMLAADSPIGEVVLDLEERWLAIKSAKPKKLQLEKPILWKDKKKFLPPLQTYPLEYLTLQQRQDEADLGVSCGTLRCLIDMVEDGIPYEPLVINNLSTTLEFELRVVIWNVTDIGVFKGASGERNDLKVRVELFVTGIDLEDSYEIYHTDVHMFAKTTATYNWRIVKKIRLPLAALSLRFTLVDNNATHDDDALYGSETLSLDALTHTTMTRLRSEEKLVDPLDYTVTFDEPMGQGMVELWCQSYWCAPFEAMGCPASVTSCCNRRDMAADFFDEAPEPAPFCGWLRIVCCGRTGYRRRVRRTTGSPAHLHCTVALLPKEIAEQHPAGQGRSAPDELPEPPDRPSPNLMFTDPIGYLNMVVGQQTCALIKATSVCFCGVLILGIIAFVIAQIVIAARMP